MNPYIEIIRLNICFLAIFGLIVGLLLVKIPINLWIFPILAVFLITASGNVINDYFDYRIDKINRPERPLPAGKISSKEALALYLALASLGLIISFLISFNFFFLALFNSALVFLYSKKLKRTLLGNAVDSWLACSVFIAPLFILSKIKLSSPATALAIIAFFGNYGREVLKDVEDVKGDKIRGAKTVPIVLGNIKATILGKVLVFVASILLFLPYILGFFSQIYFIFAIFLFLFSLYVIKIENVKKVQKMLKVLMFLVILSFLVSLFFE
jgi:geranylgeranylglycerol-phosphate geranylgeranyltransferase